MKKVIAASMMALSLNACVADEGRDRGTDGDRFVGASTLLDIINWVGAEAGSFVAGEIFSLALPSDAADLSQDALDEIRKIVAEEIQTAAFTEYAGRLNAEAKNFNQYFRSNCESGVTEKGDCSVDTLNRLHGDANDISDDVEELYYIYREWVSGTEEDVASDEDWRVFLSGNIRLAMTIDLAMLREVHEIERILGLEQSMQASWNALTVAAGEYHGVLSFIDSKYKELEGQYGEVKLVDTYWTNGDIDETRWKACFDAPGGLDCGDYEDEDLESEDVCGFWGKCTWYGLSKDELVAKAEDRKARRMATFEQMAVGDEGDFASLLEEVGKIKSLPFVPPTNDDDGAACEAHNEAIEAGPLWSSSHAQDTCPGVCTDAGGTHTGHWWTTVPGEMSVCECSIGC